MFKRIFFSVIFIFTIAITLSLPSFAGSLSRPNSDNFIHSGCSWYQVSNYLSEDGGDNNLQLYSYKNPTASVSYYYTGYYQQDVINFGQILTSTELVALSTADWWTTQMMEYYGQSYTATTAQFNSGSAYVVFWFSHYIALDEGDEVEFWLKTDSKISRTQYQDEVFRNGLTIDPFLVTVTNPNSPNTTWNWSIGTNLMAGSTSDWGCYRSVATQWSQYLYGIGFKLTNNYNATIPSGYWWQTTINLSSLFVGPITNYFNGTFLPEADYIAPIPPLPPQYKDILENEEIALNSVDLVLNDFNILSQNVELQTARNFIMDIFSQILGWQGMLIISSVVISTLIIRSLLGR